MLEDNTEELLQAFRPVLNNATFSPATNLGSTSIVCHFDESFGDYIVLWEDIQMAFRNAMFVRKGFVAVSFLKGKNFKNLDPLRIRACPNIILDVVVEPPEDIKIVEPMHPIQSDEEPIYQTTSVLSDPPKSTAILLSEEPIISPPSTTHPQYKVEVAESLESLNSNTNPQYKVEIAESSNSFNSNTDLQYKVEMAEIPKSPTILSLPRAPQLFPHHLESDKENPQDSGQHIPASNTQISSCQDILATDPEDAEEQFELGEAFEHGIGMQNNYSKALDLYSKAAKQGHSGAHVNLGSMYEHGKGVLKNLPMALGLYYKAASNGSSSAQFKLGAIYYNGSGIERDYGKAITWYLKSANQGHSKAQTDLGHIYFNGLGVERNYPKAAEWYSKAANQGNASAQNSLGIMYQHGLGVTANYTKALDWYQQSADQGNSMAQNNIGELFERGQGVAQSFSNAIDLYLKSATQGNVNALYNLGLIHEHGKGVLRASTLASKWYYEAGIPKIDYGADASMKKQATSFVLKNYPIILGIDFGHLNSRCSYAFLSDPKDLFDIISWPKKSTLTPTVPTYNAYDKHSSELSSWGWGAMQAELRNSMHSRTTIISKYKNLISTGIQITPFINGITVSDAICDYLTSLHNYVTEEILRGFGRNFMLAHFRYGITVPPQWTDEAKTLLRQAASKSLINETDHPERLLLISDLDATVSYLLWRQTYGYIDLPIDNSIIVHYTSDDNVYIAVYENVATNHIQLFTEKKSCRVLTEPWPLEDNFRRFLETKFNKVEANFPSDILSSLVNTFSEVIKPIFDGLEDQYMTLPANRWFDDLMDPVSIGIDDGYLILTSNELREHVFDPVINDIIPLFKEKLGQAKDCSAIVLSGKDHCFKYLEYQLGQNFPGLSIHILPKSELGAARGTVIASIQSHAVHELISHRCYGISLSQPFENSKDNFGKLRFKEDGAWCQDRFFPITKKGQKIGLDECISAEFMLKEHYGAKEDSIIAIYSTDEQEQPRYITDPGVSKFIEVPFHYPYQTQSPLEPKANLNVRVKITFRLYEVQAEVSVGGKTFCSTRTFVSG